jgi:hypothetical protein
LTFRITLTSGGEAGCVIRLEGRFSAEDLPVFESCLEEVGDARLALDLAELRWVDPTAVDRLVRAVDGGARIAATSPFVERLLGRPTRPTVEPERASAGRS